MQTLDVYLWQGLGNRINCLAAALATSRPLHVVWANNRECPLSFADVFQEHPQIVKISEERGQTYPRQLGPDVLSHFYPLNITDQPWHEFYAKLQVAYDQVLAGLLAKYPCAKPETPRLGLQVRNHFAWYEKATVNQIMFALHQVSEQTGISDVWLMADRERMKKWLIRRLRAEGFHPHYMNYPDLQQDLDRQQSIKQFLEDFAQLAQCQAYVINNSRSTVCDAFLMTGRPVHYAFDDGFYRRQFWPEFYQLANVTIHERFSHKWVSRLRSFDQNWGKLAAISRPALQWAWIKYHATPRRRGPAPMLAPANRLR